MCTCVYCLSIYSPVYLRPLIWIVIWISKSFIVANLDPNPGLKTLCKQGLCVHAHVYTCTGLWQCTLLTSLPWGQVMRRTVMRQPTPWAAAHSEWSTSVSTHKHTHTISLILVYWFITDICVHECMWHFFPFINTSHTNMIIIIWGDRLVSVSLQHVGACIYYTLIPLHTHFPPTHSLSTHTLTLHPHSTPRGAGWKGEGGCIWLPW